MYYILTNRSRAVCNEIQSWFSYLTILSTPSYNEILSWGSYGDVEQFHSALSKFLIIENLQASILNLPYSKSFVLFLK